MCQLYRVLIFPSILKVNNDRFCIDGDTAVMITYEIIKAIDNKEKIIVYGDYDADGITSSTIVNKTVTHIIQFVHSIIYCIYLASTKVFYTFLIFVL